MAKLIDFSERKAQLGAGVRKKEPPRPTPASRFQLEQLFRKAASIEETDPQGAMELYSQILHQDLKFKKAWVNRGVLLLNNGQAEDAKKHFEAAIRSDPNYALAYFDLGIAARELGDYASAIEATERALQIDPSHADAHYNLALAYDKTEEYRKALRHWKAYLALDAEPGPHHLHATERAQAILQSEKLSIVPPNGKTEKVEKGGVCYPGYPFSIFD